MLDTKLQYKKNIGKHDMVIASAAGESRWNALRALTTTPQRKE